MSKEENVNFDPEDVTEEDDQSEGTIPDPTPLPLTSIPDPPPLPVTSVPPQTTTEEESNEKIEKVYTSKLHVGKLKSSSSVDEKLEKKRSSDSKVKLDRKKSKAKELKPPQKVDLKSKLKYFESEIEKEKNEVQKLHKASADLAKYRDKKWNYSTYGRERDGICGPKRRGSGRESSTEGSGTERGRSASSDKNSNLSLTTKKSKAKKLVKRISDEKMSAVPRRSRRSTVDEATSTSNSQEVGFLANEKKIKELTEVSNTDNFHSLLTDMDGKLLFVKFYAPWCRPCQKMNSIILQLANEYPEVTFVQVDIDKEDVEGIIDEFDVGHIPAFYYFKQGGMVAKFEGITSKAILVEAFDKHK